MSSSLAIDFTTLYTVRTGRIDRATFWLGFVLLCGVYLITRYVWGVCLTPLAMVLNPLAMKYIVITSAFVLPLAFLYPAYPLFLKRMHDRDRSGAVLRTAITLILVSQLGLTTPAFVDGVVTTPLLILMAVLNAAAILFLFVELGVMPSRPR